MSFDLLRLDSRVAGLVASHRRALGALDKGMAAPVSDPWLDPEKIEALEASDDSLAPAIAAWLLALAEEQRAWAARAASAALWQREQRVAHDSASMSLAALRRAILGERSDVRAEQHARAFSELAEALSGRVASDWVERLERSRLPLSVHRLDAPGASGGALALAEHFLAASEDLARAVGARSAVASLRATLGRDAGEGWPARLNAAWLDDRFRPGRWLEGRRLRPFSLPAPLGASSFARALGTLGVAMLEAGRSASVPWCLHQHPRGTRRHRRRALFASLVGSEPFARSALGLGRERAREQTRGVARAFLVSLRIDAARVAWLNALADSESQARELFAEMGERVVGEAPPRSWFGVLPTLRTGDAPWLVGAVMGANDARTLVARFDEDWFHNPRAAEAVQAADAGALDDAPLDPAALASLVADLVAELEAAIG